MHIRHTIGIAALLGLTCAGCGEGQESEEETVRTWAGTASAAAAFWQVQEPVAVAFGEHTFSDPACPSVTEDGTSVVIQGDCTTSDGQRRLGGALIQRGASEGDFDIVLSEYGTTTDLGDVRTTGTVQIRRREADLHDFSIDVEVHGLSVTTALYEGSVRGGYEGPTTWNGTGTFERTGFGPTGQLVATTVDQRFDASVCEGQPISGTTTLVRAGRRDVITYDGATDCDEARAAAWSVDGTPRGPLTGIACSATPGTGARSTATLLWGLAGLVWAAARRRTRR